MRDDLDINSDTELLTAYLDNELDASERAALEQRLVTDEALRLELRELRRAWDLLDAWPELTVSRDFTTTTMKMIAKVISEETNEPPKGWNIRGITDRFTSGMLHTAVIIPLFVVLIGGGIAAGYLNRNAAKEAQLRKVSTSAVLPTLKFFPNMDIPVALLKFPMLDMLSQTDLTRSTLPIPPTDVHKLVEWLDRLDAKDKELLQVREDDFQRLPETDQQRYTTAWIDCCAKEDCIRTQQVASLFAALLQSMESGKRAQLLSLPDEERVKRLEEEAYFKIALWYADNLNQADRRAISNWIDKDLMPLLGDTREIWRWLIWMGSFDELKIRNHEELIETLIPNLSPNAQNILKGVAKKDRGVTLLKWILYAEGLGNATSTVNTDNLIDVYRQMPDSTREFIDLLHPKFAEQRLSVEFKRTQVDNKLRKDRSK